VNRGQVIQLCEHAASFADDLLAVAQEREITTPEREAFFLSQLAHESAGFTRLVENLNYSRDSLLRVFKKYFPDEASAERYARKPEAIANKVYGSRLGNDDEASGDGWRYRGRGLIQLTGRNNYYDCSLALFGDATLVMTPERLELPRFACESAGWFWQKHGLNEYADHGDFAGLTKRINGGLHGYDDHDRSDLDSRMDWLLRARAILNGG
jgi:putative chitinase